MQRLVRDPEIQRTLGISNMTLWRYRRDGLLPKPQKLRGQNVTPEDQLEAAIERLLSAEVDAA